jgi:hypothetical protein
MEVNSLAPQTLWFQATLTERPLPQRQLLLATVGGGTFVSNTLFARLRALARSVVHIIVRCLNLCPCRWWTAHPEPTVRLVPTSDWRFDVMTRGGSPVRSAHAGICAAGGEQSPSLPRRAILMTVRRAPGRSRSRAQSAASPSWSWPPLRTVPGGGGRKRDSRAAARRAHRQVRHPAASCACYSRWQPSTARANSAKAPSASTTKIKSTRGPLSSRIGGG